MASRQATRLALHWLVVISMITATLVVPAQAATDALQAAAVAQMTAAMADMPRGDTFAPPASQAAYSAMVVAS